MSTRGRKPRPPELRVVDGTQSKRKMPGETGRSKARSPVPSPPAHLNKTAKSEWRRVAKSLHALGMLTGLDRALLAAYCDSWAMYVEARKEIEQRGHVVVTDKGNLVQSPWVGIANKAKQDLTNYAAQLGLDPTARTRLGVGEGDKPKAPGSRYF